MCIRDRRETMENISSLKTVNSRIIKVDKSSIINNVSKSKIIRIALLTPNLGAGIESIKSLKTSELAWSILPKEDQKKDDSFKIIYENEVIFLWKLIKKSYRLILNLINFFKNEISKYLEFNK